jgi:hypothetical protein
LKSNCYKLECTTTIAMENVKDIKIETEDYLGLDDKSKLIAKALGTKDPNHYGFKILS